MNGPEKAIVIIVVACLMLGVVGGYFDSQTKQACYAAAGNNLEAIRACR